MTALRLPAALALFSLCVLLIVSTGGVWTAALGGLSLAAHFLVVGSLRRALIALWPVVFFAVVLVLLQWAGGTIRLELPVKTVGVFAFVSAAIRLLPWGRWTRRFRPGSAFYAPVLFLMIVMHFVAVLRAEARRALVARNIAAPMRCRPGWYRSLAWAMAGILRRTLERAERFYAAQSLRGLDA